MRLEPCFERLSRAGRSDVNRLAPVTEKSGRPWVCAKPKGQPEVIGQRTWVFRVDRREFEGQIRGKRVRANPRSALEETYYAHFKVHSFILGCYYNGFTYFNAQKKKKTTSVFSCRPVLNGTEPKLIFVTLTCVYLLFHVNIAAVKKAY